MMKRPYRVKANGLSLSTSQPRSENPPKNNSLLLTREEVAYELSVSTKTVDRLITKGHFKPTRIGKLIRIPFEQVERFAKGDHPNLDLV